MEDTVLRRLLREWRSGRLGSAWSPAASSVEQTIILLIQARPGGMWLLYQLSYALLALLAGPILLLLRGRHYLESVKARLGGYTQVSTPGGQAQPAESDKLAGRATRSRLREHLWIHAVSVGEVGVAESVAALAPKTTPLVVTTITPSGQERARARLTEARVTYLPFEFSFAINRFFASFQPSALVLCEGDYWPLLLRHAQRRQLPIVVVNGRVSDASFRRMGKLKPLLAPLFSPVTAFAVQTARDQERLVELGVAPRKIAVTGNLKFETDEPPRIPALEDTVEQLADGRPVIVAGSTMNGEEEQVVQAFRGAGGGERALLILAPRHPERWQRVVTRLEGSGLRVHRRSDFNGGFAASEDAAADVLVLDSIGELAGLYRLATAVFIGGTLVSSGGHNPLEPARFGVPIAVGPSMHNFQKIADDFDAELAWRRAETARELGEVWRGWLDEPATAAALGDRGRLVFEGNRGSSEKTRRFLEHHLPSQSS